MNGFSPLSRFSWPVMLLFFFGLAGCSENSAIVSTDIEPELDVAFAKGGDKGKPGGGGEEPTLQFASFSRGFLSDGFVTFTGTVQPGDIKAGTRQPLTQDLPVLQADFESENCAISRRLDEGETFDDLWTQTILRFDFVEGAFGSVIEAWNDPRNRTWSYQFAGGHWSSEMTPEGEQWTYTKGTIKYWRNASKVKDSYSKTCDFTESLIFTIQPK